MGLTTPSSSSSSSSALTDHQAAKLAALTLPGDYDEGRALIARTISAVPSECGLALNIDGSVATDVSSGAHTLVLVGDADLNTDQAWAGDSSLEIPAVSDGASIAAHADHDLLAGDFDVRFAFRNTTAPPFAGDGIGKWSTGSNKAWNLSFRTDGDQLLRFEYTTNGSTVVQADALVPATLITEGEWHVARACRIDDTLYLMVDEVLLAIEGGSDDMTGVDIYDEGTPSIDLEIGGFTDGSGGLVGFIDGVYIQVGGTIAGAEYLVDRTLFSATEKIIYQAEQSLLPVGPALIERDRTLTPMDGEQVYRFTGAHTATLPPMSTWGKCVWHFFNDSSPVATPEIAYDDADKIDGVLGSAGNITLPTQYGHCKLRKQTSNTAIAEGRFSQP